MNTKPFTALAVITFVISGCSGGPKETGGTLLGGAAGAIIGSQIGGGTGRLAAVAVGTLLGAMAGSAIGRSLDREDQRTAAEATRQSLDSGQAMQWQSSKNPGVSGTITPLKSEGSCREYQQTVVIGGKTQQAYGKACKDANGDWKVVN